MNSPLARPDTLITVDQTVDRLGGRIKRSALYEAIRRGEFPPARRLGRRIFISVPHLDRWLRGTEADVASPSNKARVR